MNPNSNPDNTDQEESKLAAADTSDSFKPVPPTATPVEAAGNAPESTEVPEAVSAPAPTTAGAAPATPSAVPSTPEAPKTPLPQLPNEPLPGSTNNQAMVVGGAGGETSYDLSGKKLATSGGRGKKKWIFLAVIVAVLLVAGYVFAFYLPNRPENVWKTGLNRTGDGLNALVEQSTAKDKMAKLSTAEIDGTLDVDSQATGKFGGTFKSQSDEKNGTYSLDVTLPKSAASEAEAAKLGLNVLTQQAQGADYPDVYFRLSGISALGLDAWIPGLNDYDNKWVAVSSDYIKQHAPADASESKWSKVTNEDVTAAVRDVTKTTTDYVFTTDSSKNAIEKKAFVGKETADGVKTYRYTAFLNRDHAKAYCQALADTVAKTDLFKKLVDESERKTKLSDAVKDCKDSVNRVKQGETFDVWIASSNKLIHKVRLYDTKDKQTYAEFGQKNAGSDRLTLFSKIHSESEKMDMQASLDFDLKAVTATGKFTVESNQKDNEMTVDADFNLKFSNDKVDVKKPEISVPIEQVLDKLGLNNLFPTGNASQLPASDTKTF
jgi:hypothetical protein